MATDNENSERQYKILLVDSDPEALEAMAALLNDMGHEIKTAQDAQQALQIIHDSRVQLDIVLSNLYLRFEDSEGHPNSLPMIVMAKTERPEIKAVVFSEAEIKVPPGDIPGMVTVDRWIAPPTERDRLASLFTELTEIEKDEEDTRDHFMKKVDNWKKGFKAYIRERMEREKKIPVKPPYRQLHPNSKEVFEQEDNTEFPREILMAAIPDYKVDRGVEEASQLWGFKNFPRFLRAVCDFVELPFEDKRSRVPVICNVGPGDGTTLRELRGHKDTRDMAHVGFADSMRFALPQLLENAILSYWKEAPEYPGLMKFIDDLSTILLNEQGLWGLLQIRLGVTRDENQLRSIFMGLSKTLKKYVEGHKEIFRAGEFAKEKAGTLHPEALSFFKEYLSNPVDFFTRYFASTLSKSDPFKKSEAVKEQETLIRMALPAIDDDFVILVRQRIHEWNVPDGCDHFQKLEQIKEAYKQVAKDLKKRVKKDAIADVAPNIRYLLKNIRPIHVRRMNFEEIGETLNADPEVGETCLFDAAYDSRALSHLSDQQYKKAMNEILARLRPGGAMVDDGIMESYTRHLRVDELKEIADAFGDEYRFYLVGSGERPYSVFIQRGKPNAKGGYDFLDEKIIREEYLLDAMQLTPLGDFERTWHQVAFQNTIIKKLRWGLLSEFEDDVEREEDEGDYLAVWRAKKFGGVHETLQPFLDEFFKQVPVQEAYFQIPEKQRKAMAKVVANRFLDQRKDLKQALAALRLAAEEAQKIVDDLHIQDPTVSLDEETRQLGKLNDSLNKANRFLTISAVENIIDASCALLQTKDAQICLNRAKRAPERLETTLIQRLSVMQLTPESPGDIKDDPVHPKA